MTKDKFQMLCKQVLIPRLGDLIHKQFADVFDAQETIARELVRIGSTLDRLDAQLKQLDGHADIR